jgi:hypothetical protein
MEEQRILDEMERNLAAEDPRLALRLDAFGQQRLPGPFTSARARTISGLLALALIAAVTAVMFALSPYDAHRAGRPPRTTPSAASTSGTHKPGTVKVAGTTAYPN